MTAGAPPAQDPRAWIAVSNRHAQVLLDVLARFAPESAGQFGVTGLDEAVSNLSTENREKGRAATAAALATLQAARKTEQDPLVRQDLDILIKSAQTNLRGGQLFQERMLPYTDVTAIGLRRPPIAARRTGRTRAPAGGSRQTSQVRGARRGL